MSVEPRLGECVTAPKIVVCYGPRGVHRRIVGKCWTCDRRTPQILRWDGAWYGTTGYCIACLDGWQDGERMVRPFYRYWKRDRAAQIKALWDSALMPDEYRKWVDLDVHRATCHDETGDCNDCQYAGAS